MLHYH